MQVCLHLQFTVGQHKWKRLQRNWRENSYSPSLMRLQTARLLPFQEYLCRRLLFWSTMKATNNWIRLKLKSYLKKLISMKKEISSSLPPLPIKEATYISIGIVWVHMNWRRISLLARMMKQLLLPVSLLPMGMLMELLKSVSLFGLSIAHVPLLLHLLHQK